MLHALQIQGQRRLISGGKNKKKEQARYFGNENQNNKTQNFPYCPYCKKRKTNHPPKKFWWRSNVLKHTKKNCKSHQQQRKTKVVEDQQEEEE
ncbi:hypothetical protein CR513_15858, partial [Mucuna pruriens]